MSQEEEKNVTENPTASTENSTETAEQTSNETAGFDEKDKKIEELGTKLTELNDKYLRLYSEFDNYRKRTTKERSDLLKTAGEDVIKSFLPVIDDFERAMKNAASATDVAAVNEGIQLIYNKLKGELTKRGLEAMDSTGKPFDVEVHEAITNIPAPSEDMKGKVIDEVEKGYLLNGKVIRFAKVVVGA